MTEGFQKTSAGSRLDEEGKYVVEMADEERSEWGRDGKRGLLLPVSDR